MVVTAECSLFYIEQNYNIAGRRHWRAYYSFLNFNDPLLIANAPTALRAEAIDHNLIITDLCAYIAGAAAGVDFYGGYINAAAETPVQYLETWASAAVTDAHQWIDLDYHCDGSLLRPLTWVRMPVSDYAATDDVSMVLSGYIERKRPDVVTALPVSVEGYKWPLTRR